MTAIEDNPIPTATEPGHKWVLTVQTRHGARYGYRKLAGTNSDKLPALPAIGRTNDAINYGFVSVKGIFKNQQDRRCYKGSLNILD